MDQLRTRSGKYDINTIYYGESVARWVDIIHTMLTNQYDMPKIRIGPSKYGFDSYVYILSEMLINVSIDDVMIALRGDINFTKYVEIAHVAWTDNYIYWKNNQHEWKEIKKDINVAGRNDRATTLSSNLCEDDLGLYQDIIGAVFDVLTKKILEAGMQNLKLG